MKTPEPPVLRQPKWATIIPGRRPERKTYWNRGHAITSLVYDLSRWWQGTLWEWVDGEWVHRDQRDYSDRYTSADSRRYRRWTDDQLREMFGSPGWEQKHESA